MIADDHGLFCDTVLEMLGKDSTLDVTGVAPNGKVLLEKMALDCPDIVLLDLEMPVMDGHSTLKLIRNYFPAVKTIILTVHYNEYYIAQLMLQGAAGYLSKSAGEEAILRTIDKVFREGFYFNEKISREVMMSLLDNKKLEYLISDRVLNDREIRTLRSICNGRTYKEAATELHISVDTVKFHVKSIYKKTQINSIAGLVKYAIKVGITTIN